ncbi:2'-5'-oligoadenylate synthase 3 [Microtus ochrogaster]|uniref:2'-5'-oligoadenylate synthase 3 n=1 Tax=Microtus ochrogaster TaxID=79684 RepID=A0A8J6GG03_MICOH|nr:2'-5'-oligoadenylate synthase 3 [Microtus ochrogaster]
MPLQGRSDADLIVFLSCFHQFSEQGSHCVEVISEIRAQLEACQQKQKFDVKFENSNKKNPQVLSFSLTSQTLLDQIVDFDVLPAFNALGRSDADLIVFLSCFHQFSEQGSHCVEVISEIRAQLEACQQKQKFDVKFENSNKKNPQVLSFSLTSQTLLDQIVDFDVLPAFNALGGRRGDETDFEYNCRPIILDPADPTGNLGRNAHWDLLAQDAAACTSALCCMDKDVTPIKPWLVKQCYPSKNPLLLPWTPQTNLHPLTSRGHPLQLCLVERHLIYASFLQSFF